MKRIQFFCSAIHLTYNLPGPNERGQDVDQSPFDGPVLSKQQAVPQAQDWLVVGLCSWR